MVFSISCFAGYCVLGFQELKNKSISRLVKQSIVSVTAVSTAHHADVDLLPKASHRMQVVVHHKRHFLIMHHNELHCINT